MSSYNIKTSIRPLRFEHNEMTQQELADKVKCTRQTIAALEQGHYNPSLVLAHRIAKVFGKSIEEVFKINDVVK